MSRDEAPVLLALSRATARALHGIVLALQGEPEFEPVISEGQLAEVERMLRSALQASADA